jgi:hypothetical protein
MACKVPSRTPNEAKVLDCSFVEKDFGRYTFLLLVKFGINVKKNWWKPLRECKDDGEERSLMRKSRWIIGKTKFAVGTRRGSHQENVAAYLLVWSVLYSILVIKHIEYRKEE